MASGLFLTASGALYAAARPLIFRLSSAQDAHVHALSALRWLDGREWAQMALRRAHALAFDARPAEVGGVALPFPLILAAGMVKGEGFAGEQAALAAVMRGENIVPGWRSLPRLVGPVEFGSFTRWPRLGNPGVVTWRDVSTRSTQNRVGLKNPGAQAAAAFLARGRHNLPPVYGINIAVSPGVDDPAQEQREITEALGAFLAHDIVPSWFTLNLSCPNTEDDPGGHQTEERARQACRAALARIAGAAPLWVKLGPDLAPEQYRALLRAFADEGVRAVVATNTLGQPAPDGTTAGVGGGRLHRHALDVAALLAAEIAARGYALDVVGCGGVLDKPSWLAFSRIGVRAVQYWSALVYRGPLAAALIANEDSYA